MCTSPPLLQVANLENERRSKLHRYEKAFTAILIEESSFSLQQRQHDIEHQKHILQIYFQLFHGFLSHLIAAPTKWRQVLQHTETCILKPVAQITNKCTTGRQYSMSCGVRILFNYRMRLSSWLDKKRPLLLYRGEALEQRHLSRCEACAQAGM